VFGGDLNLRRPELPGLVHVAGHDVDHVFASGRRGRGEVLERGTLSDHAPIAVTLS
jgi:endonuclease/exonuclease/phosphatase (EEP) superfamily protein YafD